MQAPTCIFFFFFFFFFFFLPWGASSGSPRPVPPGLRPRTAVCWPPAPMADTLRQRDWRNKPATSCISRRFVSVDSGLVRWSCSRRLLAATPPARGLASSDPVHP